MLSGEGNSGERWKTTIGLIGKKKYIYIYIYIPYLFD